MAFLTMAFFRMAFLTMAFFTMVFFTMAFSETHPMMMYYFCISFRIQVNINDEQKREIEILQKRIGQVRNEFTTQISGKAKI